MSTKLKLIAASLLVSVGAFFAINQITSNVEATSRDCSANAVVECGVMSVSEMRSKYNSDATKGTKDIYSGMGITSSMVNNYKVQEGLVHGNGNVSIAGKVVATNAHSAGRHQMVGGTKRTYNGTTYYDRSVSLWNVSSWSSYVFTDSKGKFVGAVMKTCGNPVKANPVQPPKPPEPPKPVYRCASLSRIKQDDPTKYVFRGKSAFENGAKATGFTFEFGDGKSQYVKVQRTEGKYAFADAPYTYVKAGTYSVKVTAHFTVNGKNVTNTSANCQKPVTIPAEPTPPAPVYIEVCRLADKQFPVRIKESDFDKRLHSLDPEDCAEVVVPEEPKMIEVCRLEDKVFPVTIKESDFDDKLHSLSPEDCDDEAPAPEPKPEPVVVEEAVTELPKTGLADSLSGLLGLGTLTTAAYYYATSRRNG